MATRKGIHEAQPVLLEPIMDVEVRVPEEYMGDVNRDLNTRRGRVLGMDADGGMQVVRAHVPQVELFTYATELRSMTGGRGTFSADAGPLRGGALARGPEDHRGAQEGGRDGWPLRSTGLVPMTDAARRTGTSQVYTWEPSNQAIAAATACRARRRRPLRHEHVADPARLALGRAPRPLRPDAQRVPRLRVRRADGGGRGLHGG